MLRSRGPSTPKGHHYPAFYACYLLKSVRTPRAVATYIGSTPNPPRRIRQHNGEISQGAWKTQHSRPWMMQMIVHGFPSKLSALRFEWAWQHPHISRHLRSEDGKAVFGKDRQSKYLKGNISTARSMICSHPYNTWPLHIKLFTEEAVKIWKDFSAVSGMSKLPRGFTCTIELEGVDGKSGQVGTGRAGPIDVADTQFTSDHLRKSTAILASNQRLICSVCGDALNREALDPIDIALCPTPGCNAMSHLNCLSIDFLRSSECQTQLIPRGGECRSCGNYILWGDVIRGCYRRKGGGVPVLEQDEDDDGDATDVDIPADEAKALSPRTKTKGKSVVKARSRTSRKESHVHKHTPDTGEFINVCGVTSSSEESSTDSIVPLKPPKSRRTVRSSRDTALASSSTISMRLAATSISQLKPSRRTPTTLRKGARELHSHEVLFRPSSLGPNMMDTVKLYAESTPGSDAGVLDEHVPENLTTDSNDPTKINERNQAEGYSNSPLPELHPASPQLLDVDMEISDSKASWRSRLSRALSSLSISSRAPSPVDGIQGLEDWILDDGVIALSD